MGGRGWGLGLEGISINRYSVSAVATRFMIKSNNHHTHSQNEPKRATICGNLNIKIVMIQHSTVIAPATAVITEQDALKPLVAILSNADKVFPEIPNQNG